MKNLSNSAASSWALLAQRNDTTWMSGSALFVTFAILLHTGSIFMPQRQVSRSLTIFSLLLAFDDLHF
jgi:hypothetical protein